MPEMPPIPELFIVANPDPKISHAGIKYTSEEDAKKKARKMINNRHYPDGVLIFGVVGRVRNVTPEIHEKP